MTDPAVLLGIEARDPTMARNAGQEKLTLFDAVGMAIGAMVGGGIFAVLGQAVKLSGNAAFLSFGLAGVLALITGRSYSRLTLDFDEPGGSFLFLERLAGPAVGGTMSWLLILGYVFAISLYAYTFGAYGSRLVGLGEAAHPYMGASIVAVLTVLNLQGVRESGIAEDILVYAKVAILLVVAVVGLFALKSAEALPVFEHSTGSLVSAAALIFVAYEGFELLTDDYADIENHHVNLPRAMSIAIPVVIGIYILVAFVTTGTLTDSVIQGESETVLAQVAMPVLGKAGLVAVMIAAVFSTASAINATIFATGRLANRVARDHQLPPLLVRWQRGGVPVVFVLVTAAGAVAVQFAGSLHTIAGFASVVFLFVFGVVNLCAVIHRSYRGLGLIVPLLGVVGCLGADVRLVMDLYRSDPANAWTIAGIVTVVLLLRLVHVGKSADKIGRRAT
jgi:amino acid transporter